jgi:ADYC domain-containing protein
MDKLRRYGGVMVAIGLLAGCAGTGAETAQLSEAQGAIGGAGSGDLPDHEHNGRFVIGEALEADQYSPASSPTFFAVTTSGTRNGYQGETVSLWGFASLKSHGPDGDFSGLDSGFNDIVLDAAGGSDTRVKLTIVGGTPLVTHYSLDIQQGSGAFDHVCDDAIPLAGTFTRGGQHLTAPGYLTFACSDGAAYKCVGFGYPAALPGGPLWNVHQACVQMVTANSCATSGGISTRVGTSIAFYDNAGIYQVPQGLVLPTMTIENWPPDTEDYYFESAFVGGYQPALCVGHARWPVLTDACFAALPDCPSGTADSLVNPGGAVLLVASKYNQLRLERWQLGPDRVATVRGYFNGDGQQKPPFPGYVHIANDGVLMRVRPTSVDETAVYHISLFRRGAGDYFLARSDDPRFQAAPFVSLGEEGMVYREQSSTQFFNPLRLFRNAITGDLVSTTAPAAEMAALGYALTADNSLIGWVAPLL